MRCACGTEAEAGGEYSYDNGHVCLNCETFTCRSCFNAAPDTMPTHDASLCIACNSAPLPDPPNGGSAITFPVAPTSPTPGQRAIADATETRREFIHALKLSPRRLHVAGSEERAMNSNPFGDDTTPAQADFVLGTSSHPGCIDMPFVQEEVLRDGHRAFGKTIAVRDLAIDDLCELQEALDAYERDVLAQIKALRREIDERSYTLDVTSGNTLGVAA